MKVVIAIDSLKGSLSSYQAGEAIQSGIRLAHPDADIVIRPLADGGEGTVEALVEGMNGSFRDLTVTGPLGKPVVCRYGLLRKSKTAIIEMAGAAGITLVSPEDRNPLYTTTYGVGEVILDAIEQGCRRFIVGIGGSATNDGGVGMLSALGYKFADENGNEIPLGGRGLEKLHSILEDEVPQVLSECEFNIACDVTNPLCGDNGCSAIFGPQKGATPEMIRDMDAWMNEYARIAGINHPESNPDTPGSGAAGGLGYAFLTFLNGTLKSGVSLILDETHLDTYVSEADIIVTGEGRLDSQTVMGKAPIGVAKLAKKYNKKVIAFSGSVTEDAEVCNEHGIDAFFPILRSIVTLEEAMLPENAAKNLTATANQVFRLL